MNRGINLSNLIKTNTGKLIKCAPSYITCTGFTTTKPLPITSNSTLSGITTTSQYYGQLVTITNGDEVCRYRVNSNNTLTPSGSVSSVKEDAIYIVENSGLSSSYAGQYYMRSTATWSSTPPATKLIKIN